MSDFWKDVRKNLTPRRAAKAYLAAAGAWAGTTTTLTLQGIDQGWATGAGAVVALLVFVTTWAIPNQQDPQPPAGGGR